MKVIAIGIGSGVNTQELNSIASDPQHVFTVANFDVLNKLNSELTFTSCQSRSNVVAFLIRVKKYINVMTTYILLSADIVMLAFLNHFVEMLSKCKDDHSDINFFQLAVLSKLPI